MGLWLKCPGCNAQNPLFVLVCPKCGRSLNNLPKAERVYVIGPATAPAAAAHPAPRPQAAVPVAAAAPAAPKPPAVSASKPKQAKKPRKKKG